MAASPVVPVALDWPPEVLQAAQVSLERAAQDRHLSEEAWAAAVTRAASVFNAAVAGAEAEGLVVEWDDGSVFAQAGPARLEVHRVVRQVWPKEAAA